MRNFILTFLTSVTLGLGISLAQTVGSVTGTITSVKAEPLESISISIVELRKGTLTDRMGKYQISGLNPGHYTLRIQSLGAPEKDVPLQIQTGENVVIDYQYEQENIHALQDQFD